MRSVGVVAVLVWSSLAARGAAAQRPAFAYPAPPPEAVRITRDVAFARDDSLSLAMDVYRPARGSAASPAIIFMRPFRDPRRPPERQSNEWLTSWARVAAANGIVAVLPDLRDASLSEDLRRLVAHLTERASQYGFARDRITVFVASAPVARTLAAVQDSSLAGIRAAVVYYGSAPLTTLRRDLPLLLVRAGRDHPETNAAVDRLAALALAQDAPVTVLNHHTGRHGFEMLDDDAATRQVIEQTLAFVKRATEPEYQALLRARQLDAVAAGHLGAGNYREASRTMAELLQQRPTDGLLRLHYAGALLGDQQFAAACTQYRSLQPPSYAALAPGARACTLAGALDSTVAWLQRMPKGWLQPQDFRADPVFAPLWQRADFEALFR